MEASSSQVFTFQSCGDLLLRSLQDLTVLDFRRFKDKLSDLPCGYKPCIARGHLENADCIATKNILIQNYGEDSALDVTIQVFKLISLMGPAHELEERRAQNGKSWNGTLHKVSKEGKREGWRTKYKDLVINDYQCIQENNSHLGETISLQKRYTRLLLIKSHCNPEMKEHEISSSGECQLQMMDARSTDEYSPTTIQALFDPDEDGIVPKTVILQGPAGIGKTMTSQKIMLDWASGNLYQDKFEFVFYLSCRELNTISDNISLARLLSLASKMLCPEEVMNSILSEPEKILFVVDGFDELRWTLKEQTEVCEDPFQKTHKDVLLGSILRKDILKECALVITTRPFSLKKLRLLAKKPRIVEILGFTGEDREEFFHNFFKNEEEANKALRTIKDNEILFTMCAIPITCWIVCTVMKQEMKKDLDFIECKTATSIYLLYLKGLIKYHGRNQSLRSCLKKLCALANEGVLYQKILFEETDLVRHGITLSKVGSVFLNENLFNLDIETHTCYSFIHLSVQEFFAALHYCLDEDTIKLKKLSLKPRHNAVLPGICKGKSLLEQSRRHPYLTLAVRFLFGLSSATQRNVITGNVGYKVSIQTKASMEQWLNEDSPRFCTEAIHCLYESQDEDFLRRVMSQRPQLEFEHSWYLNKETICTKELSYCLKNCQTYGTITFLNYIMGPDDQQTLSKSLRGFKEIYFSLCRFRYQDVTIDEDVHNENMSKREGGTFTWLADPNCKIQKLWIERCILSLQCYTDLRSILITNQSLTSLNLSWQKMSEAALKILCDGLSHPRCKLKELRLTSCLLTPLCCNYLQSIIIANQSLSLLALNGNKLQDSGIKPLCEGLIHPGCALKELRLGNCDLTYSCCEDLCSVILSNHSLIKLDLSYNELQNSGVQLLCEGLRHPGCTLQELRLLKCGLDAGCCDDLQSMITTNQSLTCLDMTLSVQEGQSDSDLEKHCDQLRRLGFVVDEKTWTRSTQLKLIYIKFNP